MFDDLKKIIYQFLILNQDIPYDTRQHIQRLKEGTINNISIQKNTVVLKRVHAFLGSKQKPSLEIKAFFDIQYHKKLDQYSSDIIDISLDFPEKLTPITKIEQLIKKHCQKLLMLFSFVTLNGITFTSIHNEEIEKDSPEYYLANEMIMSILDHALFPFYFFEICGFYDAYQHWLTESKDQLFIKSNIDHADSPRYQSPAISPKQKGLFFGTDVNDIDHIIRTHREVYKNAHEAAKKERRFYEYDHNNIYTLKFWIQRSQQPSGYTSWRDKIIYYKEDV